MSFTFAAPPTIWLGCRSFWRRRLESPGQLPTDRPNGARVIYLQGQSGASPTIDRSNGLHDVLDKARDKYNSAPPQVTSRDVLG
jgi:ABC-type sugar transport system substrate-binding protein